MKKFWTLAAMFAAVMTSFYACEKPEDDKNRHDDEEGETPAFVSPIKADGDFSDWDALDPSKVYECTQVEGTYVNQSALTKIKVYADQLYVNIYLEYDVNASMPGEDEDGNPITINLINLKDSSGLPVHVYFDADNDSSTGGYMADAATPGGFSDGCVDWMLESCIITPSEGGDYSYDPAFFKWWGDPNGGGWHWTDPDIVAGPDNNWGAILTNGSGIATGAGDANGKYESQIMREMMMGATFADTFGIGVDIQCNWNTVGKLPNAAVSDTNPTGNAPLMKVTIDYGE